MGMPYVEAPCEAEAQCAALAKSGKVIFNIEILFWSKAIYIPPNKENIQ